MTPSDGTLRATARRIAEHARAHGLGMVHVVLHGGEPLLAGRERIALAASELTSALSGVCALDLRIHTNGVTLNERHLELFEKWDIKVGISLDGDRPSNDLHRRYRNGRSSHDKVVRAVRLINDSPRYRHLFAGLLCTIDVRNDPLAVYEALVALDPPRIDFLLPHATWAEPPLRPEGAGPTPYAAWLLAILERWNEDGRRVPVRIFDSVLRTLVGEESLTESLGLAPADLLVIETDGTIEQADSLKTAFDGAPETGLDVLRHPIDVAADHPGLLGRQLGLAGLCAQCRSCPVVNSCGGGLYAHRYREGADPAALFDHPSVFCDDLFAFITGTKERLGVADQHDTAAAILPGPLFDELATGHGGARAVAALRNAQLELARALLEALAARAAELVEQEEPARGGQATALWALFARLDADAPEALDAVLAHPYFRPWALAVLRHGAEEPAGVPAAAPGAPAVTAASLLGGLAEVAAAAAARGGVAAELPVPLREGSLLLPSVGRLELDAAGPVLVRTDERGFSAVLDGRELARVELTAGLDEPRWLPVRGWTFGPWSVAVEDVDPRRALHNWQAADRLDAAEAERWRARLAEAWRWIGAWLPQYADGVRAGLGHVTPLRPGAPGVAVSGAARDAFGNVGVALPDGPEYLALLLVHEFQHVKLGAVFDVHELFDRHDTRTYRAPWRPDPRPFEGLFQGTYAHIAVVEYWRARQRELLGQGAPVAETDAAAAEYRRWLGHTYEAVLTMAGSGSLTAEGERFVAAMRATVEPWMRELDAASLVESAVPVEG